MARAYKCAAEAQDALQAKWREGKDVIDKTRAVCSAVARAGPAATAPAAAAAHEPTGAAARLRRRC